MCKLYFCNVFPKDEMFCHVIDYDRVLAASTMLGSRRWPCCVNWD